jgi:hypothetical protein
MALMASFSCKADSIESTEIDTKEICYFGLYNQDTNELLIESDSKEYLISIEHEYEESTTLEISQCDSEEIQF